ncbi:hypothetical protein [Roseibium album]|uniref:hypothetical protein n=1 Tax=Roseibium album TaxID=311410 RepID=UPI002490A628|nr:hypothetical protein [Roseibium album]
MQHKPILTIAEYLALRNKQPNCSRALSIEENDQLLEQIRERDLSRILKKRGVNVAVLVEVLRVSPVDPDTQNGLGPYNSISAAVDALSLQLLGAIEKDRGKKATAPLSSVRRGDLIPGLLINKIALEMLQICNEAADIPDGLISLLQVLLNPKLGSENPLPSMRKERARAIVEEAWEPGTSTRKLAQKAMVNQSTVSRWRRDPLYQEKLKKITRGSTKK